MSSDRDELAEGRVRGGTRLFPAGGSPVRGAFAGASFDPEGRVFAGADGHLVVATPEGVEPLPLPPGAPAPAGPVAWLP